MIFGSAKVMYVASIFAYLIGQVRLPGRGVYHWSRHTNPSSPTSSARYACLDAVLSSALSSHIQTHRSLHHTPFGR